MAPRCKGTMLERKKDNELKTKRNNDNKRKPRTKLTVVEQHEPPIAMPPVPVLDNSVTICPGCGNQNNNDSPIAICDCYDRLIQECISGGKYTDMETEQYELLKSIPPNLSTTDNSMTTACPGCGKDDNGLMACCPDCDKFLRDWMLCNNTDIETKEDLEEPRVKPEGIKQAHHEIYICPSCGIEDDGTPMICCDECDIWYHFSCGNIKKKPRKSEKWYCMYCRDEKMRTLRQKKRRISKRR